MYTYTYIYIYIYTYTHTYSLGHPEMCSHPPVHVQDRREPQACSCSTLYSDPMRCQYREAGSQPASYQRRWMHDLLCFFVFVGMLIFAYFVICQVDA